MAKVNEIKITVAGVTGSGKTAIVELIAATLRLHGFETGVDYRPDGDPNRTLEQSHRALVESARKSSVIINEVHLRSNPAKQTASE